MVIEYGKWILRKCFFCDDQGMYYVCPIGYVLIIGYILSGKNILLRYILKKNILHVNSI